MQHLFRHDFGQGPASDVATSPRASQGTPRRVRPASALPPGDRDGVDPAAAETHRGEAWSRRLPPEQIARQGMGFSISTASTVTPSGILTRLRSSSWNP
jgi:hypothetical protein